MLGCACAKLHGEMRIHASRVLPARQVELAAYLGPAVVSGALLEKMPAAMKKDVEALLEALPPGAWILSGSEYINVLGGWVFVVGMGRSGWGVPT